MNRERYFAASDSERSMRRPSNRDEESAEEARLGLRNIVGDLCGTMSGKEEESWTRLKIDVAEFEE